MYAVQVIVEKTYFVQLWWADAWSPAVTN